MIYFPLQKLLQQIYICLRTLGIFRYKITRIISDNIERTL